LQDIKCSLACQLRVACLLLLLLPLLSCQELARQRQEVLQGSC
jgi:hypothetical protein